jgi:MFS transporter, DHA1 family, multidrug resistance protein
LMSIAALLLLAVIFTLPESYKPDPSFSLKPAPMIRNFISVIKVPQFYTYALASSLAFAGLFAYVADSPSVFMLWFHVSGKVYGWIFAFLSIGFIGSSQLNNLLLKYFRSEKLIPPAMIAQVVVAIVFFIGSFNGWFGLPVTIAFIFMILCSIGIINPNASALSLAPFSKNAGTASSLMGALQLGIGSLATFGISLFKTNSTFPMATVMIISSTIAICVLFIGRSKIVKQVEADPSVIAVGH